MTESVDSDYDVAGLTCRPGKKARRESIQLRTLTVGLCMWTLSSRGGWLMYFMMAL